MMPKIKLALPEKHSKPGLMLYNAENNKRGTHGKNPDSL